MAGLDSLVLDLGDDRLSVTVRRSPLAKTLSVRVDPVRGVVLVLPAKARLSDARMFLQAQRAWLAERVAKLPRSLPLLAGTMVPVQGCERLICHNPDARRGVWMDDRAIYVSGQGEHVGRRVQDFLKVEAKRHMLATAHDLAGRIDRKPARVTVKDTVSRWGSCSAQGHIALSWRLILAPTWVADYVVGHEVAHLVELNHSPAFWRIVAGLGVDHHGGRAWLKAHGAGLHRYQAT